MNYLTFLESKKAAVVFFGVLLLAASGVIAYRYATHQPPSRNGEPIPLDAIDGERIEEALSQMAAWVRVVQDERGRLPYRYLPEADRYPAGDNIIRQMITVQGLKAAAEVLGDRELFERAERSEAVVVERAYVVDEDEGYSYMEEEAGIKLGAAALTILASREGKGAREALSARERALGEFILAMQREDGSFQTFLQDARTDANDRFYSGEALFALAKLYEATGDARYRGAIERSFPYYRALLEASFFPQYAPWHIAAYATHYRSSADEAYADYVYYLADALIEGMLEADARALSDEAGRFFNPGRSDWGPPHSSSTGVYVEGLTYAYELALVRGDAKKAQRYREAILLGSRSLIQVQWTPDGASALPLPERALGALRESVTIGTLRIDQLGHGASALARTRALLFE